MHTANDISGQKFGMLTVIKRAGVHPGRNSTWLCVCECGSERVVRGSALRTGHTISCGCYHSKLMKEKLTKHDGSRTRLYKVWTSMKHRCHNSADANFQHYGGRGISVCDEWRNSFKEFQDWALSNGYRQGLTIDRINNDGNYEPSNCRWTTMSEQNRNQRPRRKSYEC